MTSVAEDVVVQATACSDAPATPRRVANTATHKAVVVHGGARDSYQLALALSEAGLLESLVTDLFWPCDTQWAKTFASLLPSRLRSLLMQRSAHGLPFRQVRLQFVHGLRCLLLDKLPGVPFAWRRKSNRDADAALGGAAGRQARKNECGLVSYSYFGFDALTQYGHPAMLFQVHPHPLTVRYILHRELVEHPECADSLRQEWELALPERDFQRLVCETKIASHYLVASSFTRASLIEHGTASAAITVVPYGVDLVRFHPVHKGPSSDRRPLRLLFIGRINQRKGISYLLEAMRQLDTDDVELTVCGRVVDDLQIFRDLGTRVTVRPSVSAEELVMAYQEADLFVFPSVAEGFGQVLLESLACGLPILSTTHTAAPDLIEDGVHGFIVEPRRADLLVERIRWAMTHRAELAIMGKKARQRAEEFTWARFRLRVAEATRCYLETLSGPESTH